MGPHPTPWFQRLAWTPFKRPWTTSSGTVTRIASSSPSSTTTRAGSSLGLPGRPQFGPWKRRGASVLVRPLVLVLLEHVLDVVLEQEDVGLAHPVDLEGSLVVPLDRAPDLFAVLEHDHHAGAVRHLLRVVVALGVGLLGRYGLARPVE